MKLDDSYYHLLLMRAGLDDGYDEWLDSYLEAEDPLSDIVLNLALCGSDLNRVISCLNGYCGENPAVDERQICERLRRYLKNTYHCGQMDQRGVVEAMYRIASAHGDPGDVNFDIWGDFYYLDDCLEMVEDGIASRDVFDDAFLKFLNEGIPLNGTLWDRKPTRTERLLHWLRQLWRNLCHK